MMKLHNNQIKQLMSKQIKKIKIVITTIAIINNNNNNNNNNDDSYNGNDD